MLLSALVKRGLSRINMWREISRQRTQLRRMSEYLAKDIGISRAEAEREADRPFWDYDRNTVSTYACDNGPEKVRDDKHDCCLQS